MHFLVQWPKRLATLVGAVAAAMVLLAPPTWAKPADGGYSARVTWVHDGDTLWVRPADGGRRRKLRIDGIDAPEICQAGGLAARDALRHRLQDQTVWVDERVRDTYGRPLVALTQGGENVAAWMVLQGWAWSYRWRGDPGPFVSEERVARARKKGIFASNTAEEPRLFRRRKGPCPRR